MRDSKDAMKTAALTGMQQQKCLREPIVFFLFKSSLICVGEGERAFVRNLVGDERVHQPLVDGGTGDRGRR